MACLPGQQLFTVRHRGLFPKQLPSNENTDYLLVIQLHTDRSGFYWQQVLESYAKLFKRQVLWKACTMERSGDKML